MEDFLKFKKMLTPIIIQVLFWVGIVLCVLSGLVQIARGGAVGIVVLLIGPIAVRVYCEVLIVLFTISDTLTEIRDNTRGMRNSEGP